MKKVLSVVLAGAMILGMSVTAFADVEFGGGDTGSNNQVVSEITFGNVVIFDKNGTHKETKNANESYSNLEEGDVLYFAVRDKAGNSVSGKADSNWRIKLNGDEYVKDATFFHDADGDVYGPEKGTLYVKVTLEKDFDTFNAEDVNFYFYIYDTKNKTSSQKVRVSYDIKDLTQNLKEEDLDWVLTVKGPTKYKYDSDAKSKLATFDFNGNAYAEVKLYPGETYNVDYSTSFNKDIARAYPEADFDFVELKGDFERNADVVIPSSKDNKYIYEVIGDELVEVDYEYVTSHKFASGEKTNGYLFQTDSLGQYAISDVELDLTTEEKPEEKPEQKPEEKPNGGNTNNGDKGNPDTGANDFVGAAVALAVVSVAAAGALALKK